jgi:hypothetical protein
MTRMPGRAEVNRVDSQTYLRQIASVMARIHSTRGSADVRDVIGTQPSQIWAAPVRRPLSALLRRAQRAIEEARATKSEPVLSIAATSSGTAAD